MRQSVRDYFLQFTSGFEGRMPCMYLDTHTKIDPKTGQRVPDYLVTTGRGNLLATVGNAQELPWIWRTDGRMASKGDIAAEYLRVKNATEHAHGSQSYWTSTSQLFLPPAAVDTLCMKKVDEICADLTARLPFATFPTMPADAELALISMSWAMGAAFHFPVFEAAMLRGDFAGAAAESAMDNPNHDSSLARRNAANCQLLINAQVVKLTHLDPETLFYPTALPV